MVQQIISTAIGKVVKRATALRGGGSALPGLVVEKIDPKFLSRTLAQLPLGVVIVSGTNGKTTTTKIVVELLEAAGLKADNAEVSMIPSTKADMDAETAPKLLRLIDMLEDCDDVQEVYHNGEISDEVAATL